MLLLQGPVGPFFARLAADLRRAGARVWKVHFNGGDALFGPQGFHWRGAEAEWPGWLARLIDTLAIDHLVLFGDCRPVHRAAIDVAAQLGIAVHVFEEGYLRPDFITLERGGVNGYRSADAAWRLHAAPAPPVRAMPRTFWPMVGWAFAYYAAAALWRWRYPRCRHHRALTFVAGLPWLRSAWRKAWYAITERAMAEQLTGPWSQRFFLVPLQVHDDAQVVVHGAPGGMPAFIVRVIAAFAGAAPADMHLVFKHHPLDRGCCDYAALIAQTARAVGCGARVHYIHDQHMPTILPHARGVVVANSSAGLAAIGLGRPTIALARAIYDAPGLTFQGPLDAFWAAAPAHPPDPELAARFRAHLIATTQINGSFYRRLEKAGSATGLPWAEITTPNSASARANPPAAIARAHR